MIWRRHRLPGDGQRYIVGPSPTGPWAGRTGQIAAWQDGAWSFFQPKEGWLAWVDDEDKVCAFDGSGWVATGSGGSVNPTPLVGVATTADASNRLAVASPASLFTHAGAGHQIKINKAAATDTASQLFQTNFSGRAELGLMGDDNFRFKVSPDGAAWTEAILIDKVTGLVTLTPKSVSNAALADLASARFKGRATAGSGAPEDLTAAQARTILNVADGANNYVHPNHGGDVTSAGEGATTIAVNAVSNAKLADVPTASFKGRASAGTGDPEDLTAAQATAVLNTIVGDAGSGGTKGLVPAPAAGDAAAGRFLKADGTWSAPAGGGSGSPGGSDTQLQFNDAGGFFGNAGMTYAKATRKLTLTSQETLFNHDGASRQLQINKSATGNTASILFQTGLSGRAEFGLTGDDDFHLKVSADGSAFNEAWIINSNTAEVSVRKALAIEEQASAPTTPASGLKTWARKLAGRRFAYVTEPSGELWPLQSHIGRQRVGRWNPIGNATTAPSGDGIAAPTATGTATARNVAATNMATAARRLGYVSASTAGSLAGVRSSAAQYWRGNAAGLGGFLFICRFVTSDAAIVAGARAFVGLSADTAAPTNVEPNTINNSVGAAVLSASGNLQIVTRDGATAQTIDLGAGFPGNSLSADLYELMLYAPPNGTTIDYRVERLNNGNVAEGTLTTNLPGSTTLLCPKLWRCNNATALAVGIDLVHLYIETSY